MDHGSSIDRRTINGDWLGSFYFHKENGKNIAKN
jgi:hypothetical protein